MLIVDSMTDDEIIKLFEEIEKPLIMRKLAEAGKNLRHVIKNTRNTERRKFKPIEYSTSRGFNIIIQCYDEGINTPRHKRLGAYYYAWFRRKPGIHLLTYSCLERTVWHYSLFIPHFFDRYNERFLKDSSLTKPEIIKLYLNNNSAVAAMRLQINNARHPDEYWMTCNDGICLCTNPKGYFVKVKTFISWDMLGLDQRLFAINSKEYIQKIGRNLSVPEEFYEDIT